MIDFQDIIDDTAVYVRENLSNAEGGHDWWHIHRVWTNAKLIAQQEDVDHTIVELAALLHDIADAKFHDGNEEIGPDTAQRYLESVSLDAQSIEHIVNIIRHMSFKNSLDTSETAFTSKELEVVQDADRLDAIGAVGIARAFSYGGYKDRLLFDPGVLPELNMSKEEYKKSTAPTINHFYEKLLLLKDKMNTDTGKRLAERRHQFMVDYLDQFYGEVGIENWPK